MGTVIKNSFSDHLCNRMDAKFISTFVSVLMHWNLIYDVNFYWPNRENCRLIWARKKYFGANSTRLPPIEKQIKSLIIKGRSYPVRIIIEFPQKFVKLSNNLVSMARTAGVLVKLKITFYRRRILHNKLVGGWLKWRGKAFVRYRYILGGKARIGDFLFFFFEKKKEVWWREFFHYSRLPQGWKWFSLN